jgi:putative ABC transport system permease protein
MIGDIRLALRSFRQHPGFTALAVAIVALGAAANASVSSVVRAVLIEPLPYARPDRLVSIAPDGFVSNADVEFLRASTHSYVAVAASSPGWTMSLVGAGDPVRVTAAKASANLFATLGVRALHGRTFLDGEDAPGRHRVAVLSYRFWRSRFQGDPSAVGRVVTLDDAPHEIIGVMGPDFELIGRDADLWMPLPFDRTSPFWTGTVSQCLARLRDGVDVATASDELRALRPEWRRALGYAEDWGRTLAAAPLRDQIVGDVRPSLLVLIGAVGLIVLLTAANLGTLLLGRHVARRREMAVRGALGASAWRLFRQTAVESLVLSAAGALTGVLAAWATLPALVRLLPPEMPRIDGIRLDPVVMTMVLVTSTCAVLACGALPSVAGSTIDLQPLLRLGTQSETRRGQRSLHALVTGQVAVAVVLGVAAALMLRSLIALQRVDPGFQPAHVLTLKLQPSGQRVRGVDRAAQYYSDVMAQVAAVPGVERVGAINHLPLSGYNWVTTVTLDERPLPAGVSPPTVGWRMVHGDYFGAMGIRVLAGRTFTAHDDQRAPAVAIVNEAFAARTFGGIEAALGRVIRTGSARGQETPTIVGVVGNVRHVSLSRPPDGEIYRPVAQSFAIAMALTIRTAGDPAALSAPVRRAVWSVDASAPIADLLPLPMLLRQSLGRPRLLAILLSIFAAAGLAILLSGVYGVVALSVRRREREIGIRLALGAAPVSIARLVLRQGCTYAAGGLAVGLPAGLAASAALRGLLFGIGPRDPETIGALALLVTAATVTATLLPARRALRVDPAASLKSE